MRAGRRAAVGVVAKGVDMETALSVGIVAGDVPGNGGGSRFGLLLKDDGAANFGVTSENSNWSQGSNVSEDVIGSTLRHNCFG